MRQTNVISGVRDGGFRLALLLSTLLHALAAVAVSRVPVVVGQGMPAAVISVELREPPRAPPHLPPPPNPPGAPRPVIRGRGAPAVPPRARTPERPASTPTPVAATVIRGGDSSPLPSPQFPSQQGQGGNPRPPAPASPGPASAPPGVFAPQGGDASVPLHPSPAYYSRIRSLLERTKEYPHLARRARMEGNVTVRFLIRGDGSPGELQLVRSSGHGVLDEAALRTVRSAAPFPLPAEGSGGTDLLIVVPILFRMER